MPTISQLVRESREKQRPQKHRAGSAKLPAKTRRLHSGVHVNAKKTELGVAQSGARAAYERDRSDFLHTRCRAQFAGALGGIDSWRPC